MTIIEIVMVFACGWIFGDIVGWRKGWREGMEVVEKYKVLVSDLTAWMREPEPTKRKDLPL